MKRKKNIIKILAIGSLFLISAVSFTGVISIQDNNLYSFWNVKKINYSFVTKSYADDHDDDNDDRKEKRYKEDEEEEYEDEDDEDDDNDKYKRETKSSSNSSSSINSNISTGGNTNSCHIVYDSRTTASGVSISEPVQVCDTNNGTTTQTINKSLSVDTAKIESLTNQTKVNIKPTISEIATQNSDNVSIKTSEKNKISVLFLTFKIKLNRTNYTDSKKLDLFKKVDALINEKINTLNKNILAISDYALIQKNQKKLLLLKEVQANIQSQIIVYLDAINTKLQNDLVAAKKTTQTVVANTVSQSSIKKTTQTTVANTASQKAAQAAASQKAAETAAAQKAAQTAAAQKVAQKTVNTTTSAS